MIISEIASQGSQKLLALTTFLSGRAADRNAKKQISQQAFLDLARSLGVILTPEALVDLSAQEPLSNVIEPLDPNSGIIRFKGNVDGAATGMDAQQAEKIVNQNATQAADKTLSSLDESVSDEAFLALPQQESKKLPKSKKITKRT